MSTPPLKKQKSTHASSSSHVLCNVCRRSFTPNGLTHHLRQSTFCSEIYSSSRRTKILSSLSDTSIESIAPGTLKLSGGPFATFPTVVSKCKEMEESEPILDSTKNHVTTLKRNSSDSSKCSLIDFGGPYDSDPDPSTNRIPSVPQTDSMLSYSMDPWQWEMDAKEYVDLEESFFMNSSLNSTGAIYSPSKDESSIEEDTNMESLPSETQILKELLSEKEISNSNNRPETSPMDTNISMNVGNSSDDIQNISSLAGAEIPETPVIELSEEMRHRLFSNHLTTNDSVFLDLAHTLLQWRVPLYAFDDIIKWLKRSVSRHEFNPKGKLKSYKTFLEHMKKTMNANTPVPVVVPLEWGSKKLNVDGVEESQFPIRTINVITFDFHTEVMNLLDQKFARDSKNLVLNPEKKDWYKPYKISSHEAIHEIMTGSCYQNYIKNVWSKRPDRHNCYVKGIMLYIDGTPCDGSQRFSLEPLLFTFVDFQRKVRNQPEAWGYLGLVPDIYLSSKAGKTVASNDPKRSGESSRNFHRMLKTLLQPLLDIQETGIPDYPVRIDDTCKVCTLLLPLFMVCADGLEADKLCIRKINYRKDCVRICSGCDCSCENADNTDKSFQCDFLIQSEIATLCEDALSSNPNTKDIQEEACTTLSDVYNIHRCDNAFFPFKNLGGDSHGIFGACPPCFSHVLEHGIYKRVIECFFILLSSSVLYELDQLALSIFCHSPRQTSRRRFPRVAFAHGVTNTTKLTCKEMTGLLFTLAIITGTTRCTKLLEKRLRGKQGREDRKLSEEQRKLLEEARSIFFSADEGVGTRLSKVFSSLLCFQAWTKKKDGYWLAEPHAANIPDHILHESILQRESCKTSIKIMQHMIKTTIPRTTGNGWKNQKMHNMSHFPLFINKFGSPRNYDCASMECNHKTLAKDPSFQAQKRLNSFLPQTAERIVEHQCIRRGCQRFGITSAQVFNDDIDDEIWGKTTDLDEDEGMEFPFPSGNMTSRNIPCGLKMKLVCQPSNVLDADSAVVFHDHWWNGSVDKLPRDTANGNAMYVRDGTRTFSIPGPARKFLTSRNGSTPGCTFLFTELRRRIEGHTTQSGEPLFETIRCHPNLQQGGPWYDWGEFCFHQGEDKKGKSILVDIPCKILSLFLNISFVNGQPTIKGKKTLSQLDLKEKEELIEVRTEILLDDNSTDVVSLIGEVHAVVHCCDYPRSRKDQEQDSCLMTCWSLEYQQSVEPSQKSRHGHRKRQSYEPVIRDVPISSLSRAIYVIEDYPGIQESHPPDFRRIYHVSEQITWCDEFT